jgi:quercetin dioxygenase-like cupin family protein
MRLQPNVEKIVAEPLRLKELVGYQTGAIVSRTLIEGDGGTVTVFAFDENQALSEHTVPFDALVMVVEGRVKIRISGRDFAVEEGQMIIMPAHQPHALKAVTQFKMVLVMIRSKKNEV